MIRLAALAGTWGLSLALFVTGAAAGDLALVIGNHDYRRAPDAVSARADAEGVADALRQGGYDVIVGTDLNRCEMRRKIAEFEGRVDQADRVVVFYSGHALRSGGLSYLAPTSQGNDSLVEVMMDGVPLDLLLRLAAKGSGQKVVFIDGAQLDGFTPRSFAEPGLAHIEPPQGVLVVSAAAPGRAIARRSSGQSDFGQKIVRDFLAPGASISDAVRRLGSPAWVAGDTDSSVVLVPTGRGPVSGGTGTSGLSAAQIEDRLGLGASQRRRIQQSLSRLGYDTRGIDGVFGPGTRGAIRNWQRANNLEATGYLTQEQVAAIEEQISQASAGTSGPSAAEVEARLNLSAAERSEIQERLNILGYDTRGTGGVFGSGTRTAVRNWQRANNYDETGYLTEEQVSLIFRQTSQAGGRTWGGSSSSDPAATEASLGLTRTDRLSVEQRLAYLGFPPGPQDGFFDASTRRAIEDYQRSRGYAATGHLDRQTISGLVDETRGVRTGIVTGAQVLFDILQGLGGQQ